jgi:hypothetical protein
MLFRILLARLRGVALVGPAPTVFRWYLALSSTTLVRPPEWPWVLSCVQRLTPHNRKSSVHPYDIHPDTPQTFIDLTPRYAGGSISNCTRSTSASTSPSRWSDVYVRMMYQ